MTRASPRPDNFVEVGRERDETRAVTRPDNFVEVVSFFLGLARGNGWVFRVAVPITRTCVIWPPAAGDEVV